MDRIDCMIWIVFINAATIAGAVVLRDPTVLAALTEADAAALGAWLVWRDTDREN